MMGGAMVALAGGEEALVMNPAGLASLKEGGLSTGAPVFQYQSVESEGFRDSAFASRPGYVFYAQPVSGGMVYPHYNYGFSLNWPMNQQYSLVLRDEYTAGSSDLPPGLDGGAALDPLFPGGIGYSENSDGSGDFSVMASGIGLGIAPSPGLRLGVAWLWERVNLRGKSTVLRTYQASSGPSPLNELFGESLSALSFSGQSDRMVYMAGIQLDISATVTMGLKLRSASETLNGMGRLNWSRSDQLKVTSDALTVVDNSLSASASDKAAPFRLDSPREVTLAVGFQFDTVVWELDFTRVEPQSSYQVFPSAIGMTSGGTVGRLPAIHTSGVSTTRFAMGLGLYQTDIRTLLFGLALDKSATPEDDPLFRRVNLTTVSGGMLWTTTRYTLATGLVYRFGDEASVVFQTPGETSRITRGISLSQAMWHLGIALPF